MSRGYASDVGVGKQRNGLRVLCIRREEHIRFLLSHTVNWSHSIIEVWRVISWWRVDQQDRSWSLFVRRESAVFMVSLELVHRAPCVALRTSTDDVVA